MDNKKEECIGDWIKEKLLGSGGFGMVNLWRNRISKEAIALKQCRWGHDHNVMTARHRQRWELEIHIMKKLSHVNVVTAVSVPPVLDVSDTDLPLLAMEYCSGGDLRRVLSMPENCCGIIESDVRILIHDISAAIEYLHSKRIVHRDLKPENIVLQDINQKTRYKLIDLGYAKDLDEGSVCTSFVGTMQYLAPELFMSKKYTCTVDYWSFGLVAVECITGLRPFLHNLSPAKWMPYVRQKSPDDICAYVGADGNVIFSNEIFSHNQISRVFKVHIESWLKLMLEWDPEKRGKGNSDSVQAFSKLQSLLHKKIIHMFCIHLGLEFAYEVPEDMTVGNIQNIVAMETGLPVEEQEILASRGTQVTKDKLVIEYYNKPEDSILYVFKKTTDNVRPPVDSTLPPLVEKMFACPSLKVKYDEQRKVWAHAVLYASKECKTFNKLLQAHKVLMTNLITKNSLMNKTTNVLISAINKLAAKHEFFVASLKQDIENYEVQSKDNGVSSKMMCDSWKATMEKSLKIKALSDEAHKLEAKAGKLNTQTVELQRSPFFKPKAHENLDNVLQLILDLYDKLRKLSKDKRHEMYDNEEIVKVLYKFLKQRDKVKKELYLQIQKLSNCRNDICDIIKPMDNCYQDIDTFSSELLLWQLQRQKDMWYLIKILVSKSHSSNGSPVSLDNTSFNAERFNTAESTFKQKGFLLSGEQRMDVEHSPDYSSMSVSELVSHSSNESLRIMSDNRLLRHQMADMSEALWQKHNEILAEKNSMDFSFLHDDMLK